MLHTDSLVVVPLLWILGVMMSPQLMTLTRTPAPEQVQVRSSAISEIAPVPLTNWVPTTIPPDLSQQRTLIIGIATAEVAQNEIYALFLNVSNPANDQYGQYLNQSDLSDVTRPPATNLHLVSNWLSSRGMGRYFWAWTQSQDTLIMEVPLSALSNLFNVNYQVWVQEGTGLLYTTSVGPWYVPSDVLAVLDLITGVVGFPNVGNLTLTPEQPVDVTELPLTGPLGGFRRSPTSEERSVDLVTVSPDQIREDFLIPPELINTFPHNSQAIAHFQGLYYSADDLRAFFQQFVTAGRQYYQVAQTIGFNEPNQPNLESSLDVQYIMGVAPNVSTWVISVNIYPFWSDLIKWLVVLSNTTNIPLVHSISYGSQLAGNTPASTLRARYDWEFLKLAVRGITLVFASGNEGSGCQEKPLPCTFWPTYPAESPFVLAVGATALTSEGLDIASVAFGSGGGFSTFYPMPWWQKEAVSGYLRNNDLHWSPSSFNSSNRASPDVAALGSRYQVIWNGQVNIVDGTSAAASAIAGFISLLNGIRMSNGYPAVGFAPPLFYAHPEFFRDITFGNNFVHCESCGSYPEGFAAAPGWDPVTGLGIPLFSLFANHMN